MKAMKSHFILGNCLNLSNRSHSDLTTLTNDQIVAEIVWNALAVRAITGRVPNAIRPPCMSIC
jgi:peptidoglycan/xylan/chitin deacetylase (PgdA/CDA1 family)